METNELSLATTVYFMYNNIITKGIIISKIYISKSSIDIPNNQIKTYLEQHPEQYMRNIKRETELLYNVSSIPINEECDFTPINGCFRDCDLFETIDDLFKSLIETAVKSGLEPPKFVS